MLNNVPIRVRVAGAFAVAMALVLVTTGWLLYNRVSSSLLTELDNQLEVRAHDLTDVVKDPEDSLEQSGASKVELGESYAQLVDTRGNVVDASQWLAKRPVLTPAELRRAQQRTDLRRAGGPPTPRRAVPRARHPCGSERKADGLIVGSTLGNRAETLADLRDELLIAGPIALVLATVAGYFLAGLSLRPVDRMRSRAASISADTPGERLPVPATRDEVQRLGETLNAMLDRLESALERERGFVADAGHELRTPLALLRTELELALRHAESPEELRTAVRGSFQEVDRLAQLAEDLLLIAGSDQGRLPLRVEALDASEVLASTARRFEWRAQGSEREIKVTDASGDRVSGDRVRLEQALGNLVDNALRHGEGVVELSAARHGDMVELHVTDQGEGFPADYLAKAFERFTRADSARSGGGTGLGLSIVDVIARAHGGSAHVTNAETGGADVWLSVPSAADKPLTSIDSYNIVAPKD